MGIEPTSSAWKAEVLPLNYTRDTSKRSRPASLPRVHGIPRTGLALPGAALAELRLFTGQTGFGSPIELHPRHLKTFTAGLPAASSWYSTHRPQGPCSLTKHLLSKCRLPAPNRLTAPGVNSMSLYLCGGGGRIRTYEGMPADLQSAPVDRLGTPPKSKPLIFFEIQFSVNKTPGLDVRSLSRPGAERRRSRHP